MIGKIRAVLVGSAVIFAVLKQFNNLRVSPSNTFDFQDFQNITLHLQQIAKYFLASKHTKTNSNTRNTMDKSETKQKHCLLSLALLRSGKQGLDHPDLTVVSFATCETCQLSVLRQS